MLRFLRQFLHELLFAQNGCQRGPRAPGRIDVTLDLAEGDRALRQGAVRVKHGVVRILPALMNESAWRLAAVFREAVAVPIAVPVDPLKRRFDVGPEQFQERAVCCAFVIRARQEHKERRGVGTAIVTPEGHLLGHGHLSVPRLVQDLSRLGILFGNHFRGLRRGQVGEHPASQPGTQPQTLESGDQAVAAKRRVEPRNAGVGIGSAGQFRGQHVQIRDRAVDPGVDLTVRGAEVARPGAEAFEIGLRRASGRLRAAASVARPNRARRRSTG